MNCVQSLIDSYRLDSQHSDMGCVLSLIGSEMNRYKRKIDSPREGGNVQ